jgi:hypothetical protein
MTSRGEYIVSRRYDWAFFLLPPVVSLWLGIAIAGSDYSNAPFVFVGQEMTWAELSLGALIHAHLVAVFFRSHSNPRIFALYPRRFIWVPLVLWLAISSSAAVAVTATVVATFWDVWHSGAQTFGFARIYDRNAGVPPTECRRLEFWMNQMLYLGPILAGATLMDHASSFDDFEDLGTLFFSAVPITMQQNQNYLAIAILTLGSLLGLAYILFHIRAYRRGIRFSKLKVFLVSATGFCSIYTWGFNSWGEAFFIMNLFHAVQYLALVWAMERKEIEKRVSVSRQRWGKHRTLVLFLGATGSYGVAAQLVDPGLHVLWSLTIVVSLMHFWYDSFVWSVRKAQI